MTKYHVRHVVTDHDLETFQAGMRYAAMLVRNHWNDTSTMVNQKDQVQRSADAIVNHAKCLTVGNLLDIMLKNAIGDAIGGEE